MTLIRHRPLMNVVQVLSALVDVGVHEAAGGPVAVVSLLMQTIVLPVHHKGRVVADATALDNFAERFLKSAADLDIADASSGRGAVLAHLIPRLAIARRATSAHSAVGSNALLDQVVLASHRGSVRMRRSSLSRAASAHLLERLHVAR